LTLLRCKTCAIDIGSLKASYLLTYIPSYHIAHQVIVPLSHQGV